MDKKRNNSTNEDILSGKGLKPLSSSRPTSKQSGITTEKRAEELGVRMDRFTKDSNK